MNTQLLQRILQTKNAKLATDDEVAFLQKLDKEFKSMISDYSDTMPRKDYGEAAALDLRKRSLAEPCAKATAALSKTARVPVFDMERLFRNHDAIRQAIIKWKEKHLRTIVPEILARALQPVEETLRELIAEERAKAELLEADFRPSPTVEAVEAVKRGLVVEIEKSRSSPWDVARPITNEFLGLVKL